VRSHAFRVNRYRCGATGAQAAAPTDWGEPVGAYQAILGGRGGWGECLAPDTLRF